MGEYPEEIFYQNMKVYNSRQVINLYDFNIPISYELPCPETDDIDITIPSTEEEEITEIPPREPDIIIRRPIFITRNYLRGRKRMGSVDIGNKNSWQNIQR